ncbi:secreted RxLR effector protein 161-like [Primulina eburnea]|uniref:secreted RxLR effector protein 161-like n=1 Tax=Primulina eburnea TaxID=1245227 RepID=UPI003C6C79F3
MVSTREAEGVPEGDPVEKQRYQRLVGRLIYLSHTRPDIGFAVSYVSQFMHNPKQCHMDAVYRILRYLKKSPGKGILFQKHDDRNIVMFSDADWAGSRIDRRSTTGYCSFVWGNLVTWRSKKQPVVSRSSAEAEFRALSLATCEGIWIRRMMAELKMPYHESVILNCDNQAAISIAKDPVHHDRTKHVEIDRHFIAEKIKSTEVLLQYTPTRVQLADILTKALIGPNFDEICNKLGMYDIYVPT